MIFIDVYWSLGDILQGERVIFVKDPFLHPVCAALMTAYHAIVPSPVSTGIGKTSTYKQMADILPGTK